MPETFSRKQIEVSIELAADTQTNQPNTFAGTGADTTTIRDKRMSVRIQNSGAPSNSSAQVSIYGMTESVMNQLSTLGMVLNLVPKNVLTVKAGDDQVGLTTVFRGTIVSAYADMAAAPDVPFILDCQSGLAEATSNVPPTSYKGSVPVSTIMSGFARQMNVGFENNGVDTVLINPYYRGSLDQQRQQCARDAGINAEVVNGNVLAIWPRFGSRTSLSKIPLIAAPPDGAMIGRPSFTQQGILVRNLFNPEIAFGGKVEIRTRERALSKANGQWTVYKLDLALDAQVPKGQWASTLYCYNQGSPNPVILPPK
jgi:hypothetical protein